MANPLTGDFDAVLEVSGATVNRLLANMHQNAGSKPSIPTFPHGVWIRVGEPNPVHGMRGSALAQVSVPHIDLIHGVSDRFWLEVSVRARYTADPGTVHIPEFINGVIRAQYRIDTIDPSCWGWQKLAPDYLWIRAIGDTVSFTGTAEDDVNLLSVIPSASNAAADDARITQLARYLLTHQFEATPHRVSRRFRRGAMRSLNVGPNRSAVVVPVGISGDPSAGNIASVDQDFLEGRDVGIAVNRDYIMGKIQEQLDAIRASFRTTLEFQHKTSVDLGPFGGFDVLTVTIDYTVTLTSATAQWLGGFPGIPGLTIPGGLVSVSIHGQGLTQKAIFNFDFDVTIPTGDPAEWRYVVMIYEMAVTAPRVVSLIVRVAKTPDVFKSGPHTATYESVVAASSSTLRFGAGHAIGQTAENFFAGQIDNVAFYNVALSQADMDKHFNMF